MELQQKMIDTSEKLRIADIQIDDLTRNKIHAEITEREIISLKTDTKTYKSVGRMFLLRDIPDVVQDLKKRQTAADEKIKDLQNNKNYLERNLKEAELNLREMVQHKKEIAA